jgi:hypothetical protein
MIAAGPRAWVASLEDDDDTWRLDRALVELAETLSDLSLLDVGVGYWQRTGTEATEGISLTTGDRDFRRFAETLGLSLVI